MNALPQRELAVAGFIGGGSGAVVAGISAIGIAPNSFNFNAQFTNTMKLMAASFVVNGLLTTFAYLAKSPLPAIEQQTLVQTTTGPSDSPQTTTTVVKTGEVQKP